MKSVGFTFLLLSSLIAGCGTASLTESPDPQDEALKAKAILEGTREAYGVLIFVNATDTSYSTLVTDAGLSAAAAESIAKHVKGSAWQGGKLAQKQNTVQGQPLKSIAELDALPHVTSTMLGKLLAYAKKIGDVPDYYIDQVPLSQAEASGMIYVANTATLAALETDGGLTVNAASHVLAARPIKTVEQLGALPYVGTSAVQALRDYAILMTAPAFGAPGAGTTLQFHQMTAQSLPVSPAVTKLATAGNQGDIGNPIGLGRYMVPASTLTAVLADPDRTAHLGGDLLFNASAAGDWTKDLTADITPMTASQAYAELITVVYGDADPALTAKLGQPVKVILASMMKGLKSAKVYRLHWDNQDDTSVDGIAVLDTATGEMRVVAVFFPA